MKNPVVLVAAAVMLILAVIGIGACMATVASLDSGPSRTCVDWDTKKVTKTVTPDPKRTYDKKKKKWVNGPTPKPYKTTTKTKYCDEWETQSPTPTPTSS